MSLGKDLKITHTQKKQQLRILFFIVKGVAFEREGVGL